MSEAVSGSAPPQVVVGTAGHIDHGKTALVRALTGSDADRLPEERRRGMSIELGFAFLPGDELGHAHDLAFIDCPGHARFVRQAIAGLGAMDGCLLVVAADEGVNAQTREHLDLIRLLALRWGRAVISKADLVDDERVAEVARELKVLLAGTPLTATPPLAVSAHSGAGIAELRDWLFTAAGGALPTIAERSEDPPRLAVDRVFTVRGHGTVVTGTLLAGTLRLGDELHCHPGPSGSVRGLQIRGLPVREARAGQRTAINLARVDHDQVERGAWLAPAGSLAATTTVDVQITPIPPGLAHGQELVVHHGTAACSARVSLYDSDQASEGLHIGQLRLAEARFLAPGDRLILRRPSPAATIGAAVVVAVDAPRHRRFRDETRRWFAELQGSAGARLVAWLEHRYPSPAERGEAERWAGGARKLDEAARAAGAAVVERQVGTRRLLWSRSGWDRLGAAIVDELATRQRTGATWQPGGQIHSAVAADLDDRAWADRLADLESTGRILREAASLCAPDHLPPPPAALTPALTALLASYAATGLQAGYDRPTIAEQDDPERAARAMDLATERGWLIALSDRQHLHRAAVERVLAELRRGFAAGESIDFQWYKQHFGVSRRYALPVAEWCDRQGITRRSGSTRLPGPHLHDPLPVPRLGQPPDAT